VAIAAAAALGTSLLGGCATAGRDGNPCQDLAAPNRDGRRISDVGNDPDVTPALPPDLNVPGTTYRTLFKVCVSAIGAVESVLVLESGGRTDLDAQWADTIKKWRYEPYCVDQQPRAFCSPVAEQVTAAK
jgi:hypothetical protein